MINTGIIKKIEKNDIFIHFYKDSSCAHCSSCSPQNKMGNIVKFSVPDSSKFKLEQEISVELEDSTLLKFSFITYIIPAIAMILGYIVLDRLNFSEGISILGSFLFLVFSFGGLYFYDKKRVRDVSDIIKIIE